MVKYVIRKVPERNTENLESILRAPIIYNDNDHIGALYSFLEVLKLVRDDAIYIQDDMILCKGFCDKAEEYVCKMPNEVIVFCNSTKDKMSSDVTSEGFWSARKGGWLMCTYIPKWIAYGFLKWWTDGEWKKYNKNWLKWQFDDAYFCRYLGEIGKNVFVVVPNLAGHPYNKSVIDGRAPRITPNFNYADAEDCFNCKGVKYGKAKA